MLLIAVTFTHKTLYLQAGNFVSWVSPDPQNVIRISGISHRKYHRE